MHLEVIQEGASKRTGTKFAVAQQIWTPKIQWYTESCDSVCRIVEEGVKEIDLAKGSKIKAPASVAQIFDDDGVHLLNPHSWHAYSSTLKNYSQLNVYILRMK
jgi:hypothetical protein